ncbi:MAG: hypothetical protein ACYSVY_26115 [Planctomycetota bacterium]|jgi:hypothetical protein
MSLQRYYLRSGESILIESASSMARKHLDLDNPLGDCDRPPYHFKPVRLRWTPEGRCCAARPAALSGLVALRRPHLRSARSTRRGLVEEASYTAYHSWSYVGNVAPRLFPLRMVSPLAATEWTGKR